MLVVEKTVQFNFFLKKNSNLFSFFSNIITCCGCCNTKKDFEDRTIYIGRNKDLNTSRQRFPKNVVRNQKYSVFSFIPMVKRNYVALLNKH